MMGSMLASIPSPSGNSISLGPLSLNAYGLMIALGVLAAVWLLGRQLAAKGLGTADDASSIGMWGVAAGVVGARLYHVIGEWSSYPDDPLRIVLPPYSGLGVYGGIIGAAIGIWVFVRGKSIPLGRALDVVVPGTLFAQGIARWGNFFNQELYGPPTDLPWGISIDCVHRIAQYPCAVYPVSTTGFHPLFFYESVLTLAGGIIALALARRLSARLLDGDLASFWMVWYGGVRLLLETFREGWNWTVLGVPTAVLIGLVLIVAGLGTAWWRHSRTGIAPDPG